jgi:hypothetical protein
VPLAASVTTGSMPALAAVFQPKTARIEDSGDAALALRLERTSGRSGRRGGRDKEHEAARQHRYDKSAVAWSRSGHRLHGAALSPVELFWADHLQSSLSDLVPRAKGKSVEVNGIAHIFLSASVEAMAIPFCGKYAKSIAPA